MSEINKDKYATVSSTGGDPGNVVPPESLTVGMASQKDMSENEMPDRIWAVRDNENDWGGHEDVWSDEQFGRAVEYRRIPTLPDVMEDGHVVMECRDGELIVRIVSAYRAPSYPVYRLMVLDGDGYSEYDVDGIAQEISELPSLAPYAVQDGKIVKVEG